MLCEGSGGGCPGSVVGSLLLALITGFIEALLIAKSQSSSETPVLELVAPMMSSLTVLFGSRAPRSTSSGSWSILVPVPVILQCLWLGIWN